jgi:hypothetical protein
MRVFGKFGQGGFLYDVTYFRAVRCHVFWYFERMLSLSGCQGAVTGHFAERDSVLG